MKFLVVLVVVAGCATVEDDTSDTSQATLAMPAADAAAIVAFVNYPGTDLAMLDQAVGLDSRAATNIVTRRNGADGVSPSDDDIVFADLSSLDAIAYVGDHAFTLLRAYATAHPAPAGETVEGVAFTGWQSEAVVWGVNNAQQTELDSMLDTRASAGLIARRPFTSVTAMGPVPYVATTALTKLRTNARAWWNASHQPSGYVLTAANLATITDSLKESLYDDEGFVTFVSGLANGDDTVTSRILTALEAEIDRLAAPLLGTRYADADAARESVDDAAPVKQRTKIGGWTYLESIGVTH